MQKKKKKEEKSEILWSIFVSVHTHTEARLWFSRRSSVITDSGYKSGFRGVWNLSSPVSVCGAFMSRSLRPGRVSFLSPSKLPDGESCRRPHSVVLNRESVYVCVCVCVCVCECLRDIVCFCFTGSAFLLRRDILFPVLSRGADGRHLCVCYLLFLRSGITSLQSVVRSLSGRQHGEKKIKNPRLRGKGIFLHTTSVLNLKEQWLI